jgi:hypothetical protein
LQNRYELQILDSFGERYDLPDTLDIKRVSGAFWEMVSAPKNLCLPPESWQTLDIEFQSARFENGTQTTPAKVTVRINGISLYENQTLINRTLLGDLVEDSPGPFRLQYHGAAVTYRNIWVMAESGASLAKPMGKGTAFHPSLSPFAQPNSPPDALGRMRNSPLEPPKTP